jgi:hypothetical protein
MTEGRSKSSPGELALEPLMDPVETANKLGTSEKTLANWRVLGKGPSFLKLGSLVRYRPSDVRSFLEENLRRSTSEKSRP